LVSRARLSPQAPLAKICEASIFRVDYRSRLDYVSTSKTQPSIPPGPEIG